MCPLLPVNELEDLIGVNGGRVFSLCAQLLPHTIQRPADLLAAAAFLYMTESGFRPYLLDDPEGGIDFKLFVEYCKLPDNWNTDRPGSYSFRFTLPDFPDYSCNLLVHPLGNSLLLNCISSDSATTYSTCLSIDRYVPPGDASKPPEIKNCRELSFKIKDSVATPARSEALTNRGFPSSSLTGLPKELLIRILIYLQPADLSRVSGTCRFLYAVARDPVIWQYTFNQDFTFSLPSEIDPVDISWFEMYKHATDIDPRKTTKECKLHPGACPKKKDKALTLKR